MKIFATRGRRLTVADPGMSEPQPAVERSGLPHRFEAVGEALISGSDVMGACSVAGEELARDGASVEETLAGSPAFARVEPRFYVLRQGTAYVYIHVLPWEPDRALVRLVAQLARGVEMTPDLAIKLLRLNARLRFGAFGYVKEGSCVVFGHTLLGGETTAG